MPWTLSGSVRATRSECLVDGVRDRLDALEHRERNQLGCFGRDSCDRQVHERQPVALGQLARAVEVVGLAGLAVLVGLLLDVGSAAPETTGRWHDRSSGPVSVAVASSGVSI